jgi:hypothetical protein
VFNFALDIPRSHGSRRCHHRDRLTSLPSSEKLTFWKASFLANRPLTAGDWLTRDYSPKFIIEPALHLPLHSLPHGSFDGIA